MITYEYIKKIADILLFSQNQEFTLTNELLNAKIAEGEYANISLAFILLDNELKNPMLINYLQNAISANTLNTVIPNGQYAGQSVAWLLSIKPNNWQILKAEKYRLAKEINERTLVSVAKYGEYANYSLAFILTMGNHINILIYHLANAIENNKKELVHSILSEMHQDNFIAEQLLLVVNKYSELTQNKNYLLEQIDQHILADIFTKYSKKLLHEKLKKILHVVLSTDKGIERLRSNDYMLAKKLDINVMFEVRYYDLLLAVFFGTTRHEDLFIKDSLSTKFYFHLEEKENIGRLYATLVNSYNRFTNHNEESIQIKNELQFRLQELLLLTFYQDASPNEFLLHTFNKKLPEILEKMFFTPVPAFSLVCIDMLEFLVLLLSYLLKNLTENNREQIDRILSHLNRVVIYFIHYVNEDLKHMMNNWEQLKTLSLQDLQVNILTLKQNIANKKNELNKELNNSMDQELEYVGSQARLTEVKNIIQSSLKSNAKQLLFSRADELDQLKKNKKNNFYEYSFIVKEVEYLLTNGYFDVNKLQDRSNELDAIVKQHHKHICDFNIAINEIRKDLVNSEVNMETNNHVFILLRLEGLYKQISEYLELYYSKSKISNSEYDSYSVFNNAFSDPWFTQEKLEKVKDNLNFKMLFVTENFWKNKTYARKGLKI